MGNDPLLERELLEMPDSKHNNPPDVVLNLTHEQATFLLNNMLANNRLCLQMIMSIAPLDISIEQKQAKAEPIVRMQDRFRDIQALLRAAGAREPEEE